MDEPIKKSGFSLTSFIVAGVCVFVIGSVMWMAMNGALIYPRAKSCSMNMNNIYRSLTMYALDNAGAFPRSREFERTNLIDPNDPAFGANCLHLLVVNRQIDLRSFRCPAQNHSADEITVAVRFNNIEDGNRYCDYAYDPRRRQDGEIIDAAILADRPPRNPDPSTHNGLNSGNHKNSGQNVLLINGRVDWTTTPNCGIRGDNIFRQNPEYEENDSWVVP